MSIARHFDALAVYRSAACRIVPVEGEPEDLVGEGGGLERAFEERGRGALVGVLRDPEVAEVFLADGDLQIRLGRLGAGGRLVVAWNGAQVVDEPVSIPAPEPPWSGPWFRPDPASEVGDLRKALWDPSIPLHAVNDLGGEVRWYRGGLHGRGVGGVPHAGSVRAIDPSELGNPSFRSAHHVRWAYATGAMAGGIGSVDILVSMAKAGLIGFFGSGGLGLDAVEAALQRVAAEVPAGASYGFNLLHNPTEPAVEEKTVDLYLQYGVPRIEAAAFMGLTPAVVRYRLHGIAKGPDGRITAPNAVFAKVSRPEVAEKFLRPAPPDIVARLVQAGALTEAQAELARHVPVAEDITAEADSGGHTDHRPLVVLLPAMQRLRDRIVAEQGWDRGGPWPRIGAAGGLGTPQAVWGAFAMGADYVLTGSVNQATREAGTSDLAKKMLVEAQFFDVATGPAPDMFEIGARVQVLSRGSMYATRSQRLYDLYRAHASLDEIPAAERTKIETQLFKRTFDDVWAECESYWGRRDPAQVERASKDGRHKMALVFRWYLGMTSRWARTGDADRKRDYQMWCGPAMGAFNQWVQGSALEGLEGRTVVAVAEALMRGAAACARVSQARSLGLPLPADIDAVPVPRAASEG
jgi:PfaD family protein